MTGSYSSGPGQPFVLLGSYTHASYAGAATVNLLATQYLTNTPLDIEFDNLTIEAAFSTCLETAPIVPLALATGVLPQPVVGEAYSHPLTAEGTPPYAFSIAAGSLPSGLGLAADGLVSGQPTTDGAFEVTVEVRDATGSTARRTYTIHPGAVPLKVGSFSSQRTAHPLSSHGAFQLMRAALEANFAVTYIELDSLLDPRLFEIDLFLVNAYEVTPGPGEVDAAVEYLQAGGTLLINAAGFNGLANVNAWIAPFSLESSAVHLGCAAGPSGTHTYAVATSTDPNVIAIVDGPFGTVASFRNRCESTVQTLGGIDFTEAGVVPLAVTADSVNAVLALVPRGRYGAGQALIVTNLHVFADPEDFAGGFMDTADSQKLLLNLAGYTYADLSITMTDGPDPVRPGNDLTYTITVRNHGPKSAPDVRVVDTLPAGVTLRSSTASAGSCAGSAMVTCDLGTLGAGATATVTIVVRPSLGGTLINTATVSLPETDPAPANDTATVSTTVLNLPPSNLRAAVSSRTDIRVTWQDNSPGETGFVIERNIDRGPFRRIGTVGADITTFVDRRLAPHRTYTYRVRAIEPFDPGSPFTPEASVVLEVARLVLLARRLDFLPTAVGGSARRTVVIQNVGRGVLEGSVAALGSPFRIVEGAGAFTLHGGERLTITVEFDPVVRGTFGSALRVTSTDPGRASASITIRGSAR